MYIFSGTLKNIAAIPYKVMECLLWLLIVISKTPIYFIGYLGDAVLGNIPLRIGRWMGKKFPKIKESTFIRKQWQRIQPKTLYERYETPFYTFCFACFVIWPLIIILPIDYLLLYRYLIAAVLYILCYFVGMWRKCGGKGEYYENILQNNLEFLKLSFLPSVFVLTVLGFIFSATGKTIYHFDLTVIREAVKALLLKNGGLNLIDQCVKIFSFGFAFFGCYILSVCQFN